MRIEGWDELDHSAGMAMYDEYVPRLKNREDLRRLAIVGLRAVIDEATGFQKNRTPGMLRAMLEDLERKPGVTDRMFDDVERRNGDACE